MQLARAYTRIACIALLSSAMYLQPASAEPPKTFLNAMTAASDGGLSARLALLELRRDINAHVSFSGGVARFETDHNFNETQARIAATGTISLGRWMLDDRNMLSFSSESLERYRNRIRLSLPGLFGQQRLSAVVFDELFYDFDQRRIVRNNIALGLGGQLGSCCRVEIYHIWSDSRVARDSKFLLATVSWGMEL